jgi:hypothetical protein
MSRHPDAETVPCQSRHGAEKMLRECLDHGEVVQSRHFKVELAAERLTFQDAVIVLNKGHIFNEPEQDIRTGEWKYRIEGQEPDGKTLAIVFSFKTTKRTWLITIFSIGG